MKQLYFVPVGFGPVDEFREECFAIILKDVEIGLTESSSQKKTLYHKNVLFIAERVFSGESECA